MNIKTISILATLLIIISSCANRSPLVQRAVVTHYADSNQEITWEGNEARKQLLLKKLRVLVVDRTNTPNTTPFEMPLHVASHTPYAFEFDTLIHSIYYNRLVFKTFEKHVPFKAQIDFALLGLTDLALDSLIRTNKYKAIISAEKINIDYHYHFYGMDSINWEKRLSKNSFSMSWHNTQVIESQFAFHHPDRQVLNSHTLTFETQWDVHLLNEQDKTTKDQIQLSQKGSLSYTDMSRYDLLLNAIAESAGTCIAKTIQW